MSRETNRIRNALGWATLLAVLALCLGCAGGVDEDRQRTPGFIPPNSDPTVGRITLDLDDPDNRIPADGTTIVEAVAIVTDAQGRPIADTFVIFTSEFEDVSWLSAQRLPPFLLSPVGSFGFFTNECGEFTNSDGRASCLLRSSFTQGSTELRAEAVDIRLRATQDIEFTFSGGGPGLGLSLECNDGGSTIQAEELPTSVRIRTTVTQTDGAGSRPGAGVDVFLSTSNGQFENGRDETTLRTDALGVAQVDLSFSTSARDTTATILAATSGSLPTSCTLTISDFQAPSVTTLSTVPAEVTADNPDKQVLAVAVQLSPPPSAPNSTVAFSSPIGSFSPNPAAVDAGSGFAETLWTITSAESAQLVAGLEVPVVFGIDFGGLLPVSGSGSVSVVDFAREPEEEEEVVEDPVEVTE